MKKTKKKESNLKNVLAIILVIVLICLVGYGIKYLVSNQTSDTTITDFSSEHSDGSQVDNIVQPTPDVKVSLGTLPKTNGVLTNIDFSNFKKLFKTTMRSILVIEKTGCEYCEAFNPIISEVLEELKIEGYVLNVSELSNSEESSLNKYVALEGTPTTFIIENGKVTHMFNGYTTKDIIKSFLDLYYLR